MSLDIDVANEETGEMMDMNWLRNPFGLCNWAEDTYRYETKLDNVPEEQSLYYVINHWSYDNSDNVDKPLFLEVVQRYAEPILKVTKGYFWFPLERFPDNLSYHVIPKKKGIDVKKGLKESDIVYCNKKIGLPIEHCATFVDLGHANLEYYKNWYRDLIRFAEILQHPKSRFYCSN